MIQFIVDNKEILSFCVCVLGILLSLAFGGIRSWRSEICRSEKCWGDRDVAVNILSDRYTQRMCSQYLDIADERKRRKTDVAEIYRRPEQQQLMRELSKDLSDQERVKRLYSWLELASVASFGCIWGAIIVIVIGLAIVCIRPPISVWVIWAILLAVLVIGFVVSVTIMWILDGRFYRLVHRIMEREGE